MEKNCFEKIGEKISFSGLFGDFREDNGQTEREEIFL